MLVYLKNCISYWYMRYLLITELFMVEKWERHMFHIVAVLFLLLLSIFNNALVLNGVEKIINMWYLQGNIEPKTASIVALSNSEL